MRVFLVDGVLTKIIRLQSLMGQLEQHPRAVGLHRQAERLRRAIPRHLLHNFDHLKVQGRTPVVALSPSGACECCHLKLTLSDILAIRQAPDEIHTCPYCGCFLCGAPPAAPAPRPRRSRRLRPAGHAL